MGVSHPFSAGVTQVAGRSTPRHYQHSKCNQYIYTHIHFENESLLEILILMRSAILITPRWQSTPEPVIGVSLSEPHIDEFAVNLLYMYICHTLCR